MRLLIPLAGSALALSSGALAQRPDILHYTFDDGAATDVSTGGTGFAVGVGGTGTLFVSGGICPGSGDPAVSSDGTNLREIDTGWVPDLGASDWSVGFWLDATVGAGNTNFFGYMFGDSNSGSFRCFTEGAAGDGNILLRGPFDQNVITGGVSDVAPTHICWVYDSAAGEIRGYLDGVLNSTVVQAGPLDITGSGATNFTVFGYNGSTSDPAAGVIMDDFRFYRRAIDEAELVDWMACDNADVLQYNFDAGDATNSAVPGAGAAVGTAGAGALFVANGPCLGNAAPAVESDGTNLREIDTGWVPDLGGSDWTVGFWHDSTVGAGNTNFFQYFFGDSNSGSFRCFTEGAAGDGNIILRGPLDQVVITGGNSDDGPTHVCWMYDSAAGEIRGYLNGVLNNTVAQAAPVDITGSGATNFTVFGYNGSASDPQAGVQMDDFRLYRRVISQSTLDAWAACTDLGQSFCYAVPNSTGLPGHLTATGSRAIVDNDLTLEASNLPANSFGIFIVSTTRGFTPMSGGGMGNLCLAGDVGRGVGGQVYNSGAGGTMTAAADLTALPQSMGPISAMAGETWNFQAWNRDAVMGATTSNLTNAIGITFE